MAAFVTSTTVHSSHLLSQTPLVRSPTTRRSSLCSTSSSLVSWRISGSEVQLLRRKVECQTSVTGSRQIVAMTSSTPTPGSGNSSKIVFVAGATGQTGRRIVKELLGQGFEVRAGVRDIEKAKQSIPSSDNLEFVLADVTQSVDLLAKAIAGSDAVIVATGFRPSFDLTASWKVDNRGTKNMVDACRQKNINRLVLISSILTNGAAIGQLLNPAYIILNIFGLTLVAKLIAENYIRKSGIDYTIIRPGGLKNDPPSGNIVLAKEDTLFAGSVSRDTVAMVAVESLNIKQASYKVVELISTPEAPAKSIQELFSAISS